MPSVTPTTAADPASLLSRFRQVRARTRILCEPLATEDYVIQSMPDVSPTRWHLAHTTWFFETFLLGPRFPDYRPPNEAFHSLFNSYYNTVGDPYPRARRGLLSRPTVAEVWSYRTLVEEAIESRFDEFDDSALHVVELGLQHEQQHQELMLTDIKHVLSCNPLSPAYHDVELDDGGAEPVRGWISFEGGERLIGHTGADAGEFSFDNELPRHPSLLMDYRLQDRLVTNAEYLQFIEDDGYQRADLWLSMGWATVQEQGWTGPGYWRAVDGVWHEFTLSGLVPLIPSLPVTHVSFFEADAFARWAQKRLPTEFEWEAATAGIPASGEFVDSRRYHPQRTSSDAGLRQMYGDVWEWTASPYTAYPGYRPLPGALGEYNGKFMCNQFVLRGGSCATSQSHIRPSYRNFFPPEARWQFSGIRLAD